MNILEMVRSGNLSFGKPTKVARNLSINLVTSAKSIKTRKVQAPFGVVYTNLPEETLQEVLGKVTERGVYPSGTPYTRAIQGNYSEGYYLKFLSPGYYALIKTGNGVYAPDVELASGNAGRQVLSLVNNY